jgi:signal transduction histidine kinase
LSRSDNTRVLAAARAAAHGAAQPVQRQVLVLQSTHRGNIILDTFSTNFTSTWTSSPNSRFNFVEVAVAPAGSVGASEQATVDFIVASFPDGSKPDLVVAVAGPASVFARKYRSLLFPDVPLLLTAVDWRYLRDAPAGQNEIAITVTNDFPRVLDEMLQLLPETRHVFVVAGSGLIGRFWRRELEEQFGRFRERLTFTWFDDLSLAEMLRRSAALPHNSAIYYVTFGTDAAGAAYADERVLADLRATANAPLFGAQSVYLGAGAVGGSLMSIDQLARTSAGVAHRLLNGASPKSLDVPPQRAGQPTFDWRELQRWDIPESRLPSGSVVRYRAPSLWQEHRYTVVAAMGTLVIQALLIAGLLYQRRARHAAELDSRRNLSLAADSSRRQTISALTGSIAHELGQPLSSMIHNAQALQMMMAAEGAAPEAMGEILSDIQNQGVQAAQIIERHRTMLRHRQLDTKPLDLQR